MCVHVVIGLHLDCSMVPTAAAAATAGAAAAAAASAAGPGGASGATFCFETYYSLS